MNKHTPGPWKCTGRRPAPFIDVDDPNGRTLAVVQAGFKGDLPVEANARLIAAAPDLLEACKWALAAERALPEGIRHPELERALEAAIAKAKGREERRRA